LSFTACRSFRLHPRMLSSLNRRMAKQELNLFKFAPGQVTESCARATQVMRSEILDVATFRSRFDDMPDGFRCEACAPYLPQSAYSPEEHPCSDTSCIGPLINNALCSRRNRHRANVLSLANQVGDHPVLLTDLKISQKKGDEQKNAK
jgi:hypothetical protein